jgi:hypothetical protein
MDLIGRLKPIVHIQIRMRVDTLTDISQQFRHFSQQPKIVMYILDDDNLNGFCDILIIIYFIYRARRVKTNIFL